eukprot:Protomagalhaensia_sp_Gyna_25__702@NODE_132_length_4987_cov_161_218472_g104_i0_p2_GENE_NODE_132_length_4987_cov_161_218472_g104_i0NODE_132_length_4987_cov_161_218472_g104_i0_p2_ORF_typecomplete_len508_score68_19Y_phosphatase3/PF13350_6/7_3e39Y_phosphatase2/PF03162_13/14Y_phosphatase2/PF03162_13/0_00024Y_phosphatase/PF00102_27/1_5e03Y_phosphatase/PF00102_27/0_23DSPc/PF00782_20/0_23DUF4192/PF13830_6/4_9e02DUF4192/PF13830_6/0_05_NODE_132_length_4987_cov_161_218472_g104_i0361559
MLVGCDGAEVFADDADNCIHAEAPSKKLRAKNAQMRQTARRFEPASLAVSDDESTLERKAHWLVKEVEESRREELSRGARAYTPPPRHSPRNRDGEERFSLHTDTIKGDYVQLLAKIDRVIPNLRDLAVSSCMQNMKAGRLFRGARTFSIQHNDVYDIFVKTLRLQTVLDLRDDDLSSIQEESEARLIVSQFFPPYSVTQSRPRSVRTEAVVNPKEPMPREPPAIAAYRKAIATAKRATKAARTDPSTAADTAEQQLPTEIETRLIIDVFRRLKDKRGDLPDSILLSLAADLHTRPIRDLLLEGKERTRRLMIVNLFDTPAVRRRILMTVSNSLYAPVILLARASDKLTGTAMAPFYFCKYIMSGHDIYESYVEMLDNCGEVFCIALKIIALAQGPVLFHCSLGKDRTGVLSMLILSVLGAQESAILFDYYLTERANPAYQAYNRKFIMNYSGLSEGFCSATVETARKTLDYMKRTWGSVLLYLDAIGFDADWRRLMRQHYLIPSFA